MRYFANVGPAKGPVKHRDVPGSIGVLEAPTNNMPIGQAHCFRWDDSGLAVWRLNIGGTDLPGEWIIRNREFVIVAQESGRQTR